MRFAKLQLVIFSLSLLVPVANAKNAATIFKAGKLEVQQGDNGICGIKFSSSPTNVTFYSVFSSDPNAVTITLLDSNFDMDWNREGDHEINFVYQKPYRIIGVMNATPYTLNGTKGFQAKVGSDMLDDLARHSAIEIGTSDGEDVIGLGIVDLAGSAAAVKALRTCATGSPSNAPSLPPGATPTVMPPPPPTNSGTAYQEPSPKTALGLLTIKCRAGIAQYALGQRPIGRGPECASDTGPTLTASRTFKDGRQILLVEQIGGTGHEGDIILISADRRVGIVHVDYLAEFSKLTTPDQVVYVSQGVMDRNGPMCVQSHGVVLDWATLKGRPPKTLLSSGSC